VAEESEYIIRKVVSLTDPTYFCNRSWTLSFNMNTKSWISFHSYIPNWYMAENNFFYSGINDCCSDFNFIAGTLIANPTTTSTTSTTSTTLFPPSTTTTTSTTRRINDCTLDGTAEIVPTPSTTTTTSTTVCERPARLTTFYLITGFYSIDPSYTYDSTSSAEEACYARTFVTSHIDDINIVPTYITAQASGLTLGQTVYLYNGTDDCECVPDGWYFDSDILSVPDIIHIEDCIITETTDCLPSTTTTTTTTGIPTTTTTTTGETTTTTTTTLAPINCGIQVNEDLQESYVHTQIVLLGTDTGITYFNYNSYSIPDRFIVRWDGNVVIDTGYVGNIIYDFGGVNRGAFNFALLGLTDPITSNTYPDVITYPDDGYPRVSSVSIGSTSFDKTAASPSEAYVEIYSSITSTEWSFMLSCAGITTTSTTSTTSTSTSTTTSTSTSTTTTTTTALICTLELEIIDPAPITTTTTSTTSIPISTTTSTTSSTTTTTTTEYIPSVGFETYVAPLGFDRTAQPVDIYDVFESYYNTNPEAKYIYNIRNSATQTAVMYGTSYHYGYELASVEYTFDTTIATLPLALSLAIRNSIEVNDTTGFPSSGKISLGRYANFDSTYTFTYTSKDATHFFGTNQNCQSYLITINPIIEWPISSTKRWVIVNHTNMSQQLADVSYINNSDWIYCGDKINQVATGNSGGGVSTCKWIHVDALDNITIYGYCDHHTNSSLEGQLYISSTTNYINSLWCSGKANIVGILHIPGNIITIDGTNGSALGSNRFTRIEFEEGLETIGQYCFYNNQLVTSISDFPSTLTSIGTFAFYNFGVNNGGISIPLTLTSEITTIGAGAFAYSHFSPLVSNAANFVIEDSTIYDITGGRVWALHSDYTSTGSITLKTGTTIILDFCFINSLRSGTLNLLNTINEIKRYSFTQCHYLTGTLSIPNSVIIIGDSAFYDNSSFTELLLGTGLTTIGISAFEHLTGVTGNLVIPNNVTYINSSAFSQWIATGNLTLPISACTIMDNAFYATRFTGALDINSSVITINVGAFSNNQFTSITSSNTNYPVDDNVLYDVKTGGQVKTLAIACAYVGTITLRVDTTRLLALSLSNSLRTGTFTIPSTVIVINYGAVSSNIDLTGTLTIPSTVTTIDSFAFSSCTGFWDSLIINNPTLTISGSPFYGMTNIGRTLGGVELVSGYAGTYNTWNFSNYLSADTLNTSILNVTDGTIGSPKTFVIGSTNKARVLAAYPNAETNANARYILIT